MKIVRIAVCIVIISITFLSPPFHRNLLAQSKGGREGVVLYVSDKSDFIFVDLGGADVRIGESLDVYKGANLIAAGLIRAVMEEMSEASITDIKATIEIGDRVVVYGMQKIFKEPIPDVEIVGKEPLEEEREVKPVEEPKKAVEKILRDQLERLKKIEKETKTEFDRGIDSLQKGESKIESALRDEVSSLRDTEKRLSLELAELKKSKEEAITKLKNEIQKVKKGKQGADSKQLAAEVASLSDANKDLKVELSIATLKEADLKDEVASLKSTEKRLRLELAAIKKSKDEAISELEDKQHAFEMSKKDNIEELRSELYALRQFKKEAIANFNKNLGLLQKERLEMESVPDTEVISLKDTEKTLKEKFEPLEEFKKSTETKLKNVESKLAALKRAKEDFEKKLRNKLSDLEE